MVDKLNRNYILHIRSRTGELVTIQPPFTLELDIIRNSYASANVCSIRVYNLAENTRNLIRKDRQDSNVFRDVTLWAGYGDKLSMVFNGNVTQAWSVREGTNFVTQIESFDGGYAFANATTNVQFPEGTSYNSIIASLLKSLPHVKVGKISNFSGSIPRGNTYSGSTVEIINQLTGNSFFIDNGIANCLIDSDVTNDPVYEVSSESGLLGTPLLEEIYVVFDILFEPKLKIGQRIQLNSITGKNFNTEYKIVGLKHKAVISESVCGEAKTTIEVLSKLNSSQRGIT